MEISHLTLGRNNWKILQEKLLLPWVRDVRQKKRKKKKKKKKDIEKEVINQRLKKRKGKQKRKEKEGFFGLDNVHVATYPSAGGRRVTRGCVFQERNMRGVATNIYLRKTSEKSEKTWSTNFKCERFGSCIYARGRY